MKEPPPDEATQAQLADVLGWLSKALQLLSLLLQHGGQMEAFLDDGGVMSLCLHLSKYPVIHANLPPRCAGTFLWRGSLPPAAASAAAAGSGAGVRAAVCFR